jgi:hypothetical protein
VLWFRQLRRQTQTSQFVNPKPFSPAPRASTPSVPDALRLQDALLRSEPLALLRERIRDSKARFDTVRNCIPAAMMNHIQPGPLDEAGWSLLVANAAVGAKLRQCIPRLEEALKKKGWPTLTIRIKVHNG